MSLQQDQLHAANQTPAKTAKIEEDLHQLTCDLQRSVRYHRARERFFESWSNTISFLSLLAGSSVVVSILADMPSWVSLSAGAFVAALQAAEQVARLGSKARDHNGLAAEFLALEKFLIMKSNVGEADLRDLRAEILTIEAREPPIKRYLDLICHNQVARSIGSDDLEKLSPFQKTFAQYLNGDNALQG
ncbi:hypothetical protein [Leisingera sp. ANG-S3]|uniref:hypothetical protein n=1 Tax=Leisingera sp. ANG-S3 TaxID=1577899 RepID=UPI00057CF35E|nr:hypothetical protein [Leisingera sp. ANG-S3]KIC25411.1 hypothetical protein RA23_05995 [Leisingera sp. ANG-S3]